MNMKNKIFNWNSIKLSECNSTNAELRNYCDQNGPIPGSLISTSKQLSGKGRYQRLWESPLGNLAFSFLTSTPVVAKSYQLNLVAGLCVQQTIQKLYPIEAKLKWPNDVYVNNKKISGILSEGYDDKHCIIGIGINFNSLKKDFPAELQNKLTTLKTELQQSQDEELFFSTFYSLCDHFFDLYQREGFQALLPTLRSHMLWFGENVKISEKESVFYSAKILDIDKDGFLQIVNEQGAIKTLVAGDVIKD
jgi:BirA family transcriptional regulator, biotin operon repressor / biotin---[acetyl-CoA-carboxylase] ligase